MRYNLLACFFEREHARVKLFILQLLIILPSFVRFQTWNTHECCSSRGLQLRLPRLQRTKPPSALNLGGLSVSRTNRHKAMPGLVGISSRSFQVSRLCFRFSAVHLHTDLGKAVDVRSPGTQVKLQHVS